jgi:hypothetical protein
MIEDVHDAVDDLPGVTRTARRFFCSAASPSIFVNITVATVLYIRCAVAHGWNSGHRQIFMRDGSVARDPIASFCSYHLLCRTAPAM